MSDVVVITGAAGGVGKAIARELHASGYDVVIADLDEVAAQTVATDLAVTGARAIGVHVDVADRASVAWVLAKAVDEFGHLEALVNCAAITQARPLMEITSAEFDRVMQINAGGTFSATQMFGAYFADHGYGRIVNIASLAGQNGGTATGGHYAASKGAMIAITKVFARELAVRNVTVNAIAPGPHATASVMDLVGAERFDEFVSRIPVGQVGDPAFIGRIVALLVDRGAGFVTGATWDVNGGLYVR
ncbi:SDR family oxidoreductase [Microbacterium sp. LMC-P-041]|uniref:SDR family NAD(P)-dependent oxidoreductase n=1 Tax=Microbacterium sp. LMC-P-041 TaxID=3040293 RepID=UPI0025575C0F|nr:SDR family oxidoreductase [Microbacterium sp. LMC-P-041]